jgi:predicted enzyme related to lactoylglutathione lyase
MKSISLSWRLAPAVLVAAILGVIPTLSAAATPFPPLNDPATGESHPGKFVWAELFTADAAAATKFYTGVFDWSAVTINQHGVTYTMFRRGDHPIAGLRQRSPGAAPRAARWICYISVADIASTLATVPAAGGQVRAPALRFPDLGWQAIITDSGGSPVGLIQSNSGDSADAEPASGEWNWFHLLVKNSQAASAFYRTVFLYSTAPDARTGRKDDFLLSSGGINRGGVSTLPADVQGNLGWLGVIRVENLEAAVARVSALGGEVVVPPHGAAWGSRFAEIADPTGGTLGLVEYINNSNPANRP